MTNPTTVAIEYERQQCQLQILLAGKACEVALRRAAATHSHPECFVAPRADEAESRANAGWWSQVAFHESRRLATLQPDVES